MARDTAGFTWPPGREDKVESEGGVQDGRNIRGGGRRGAALLCAKRRKNKQKKGKKELNYCNGFQIQLAKIERKKNGFSRQTGKVSVSEKKTKTWLVSFVHDKQSRASVFRPSLHPATREQPGINGVCRTVSAPGCV